MLFVVLAGCAQVIPLTQYKYPPRSPDAEVVLIDARQMERPELQRVFDEYDIVARLHEAVRSGDRYEADVASKVEEATSIARQQGGHALLYTEDSGLIAAIFQDAGYAGPSDRLVMYILRRKEN
jgi:hypothetical protein